MTLIYPTMVSLLNRVNKAQTDFSLNYSSFTLFTAVSCDYVPMFLVHLLHKQASLFTVGTLIQISTLTNGIVFVYVCMFPPIVSKSVYI